MENASKALVMAGGVLIAIMVIATLLYAFNTFSILPESEEQSDAVKQLAEFNQQYESYNRDALYGTDLISVLNKAIDNNEKYGDDMYINIVFKINTNIDGQITEYIVDTSGEVKQGNSWSTNSILDAKTYYLSKGLDLEDITTFLKLVSKTNEVKSQLASVKDNNGKKHVKYTVKTVPASEFKAKIFKCTKVSYNSDGRINGMQFEEQDITDDDIET